ncbi:MAG TPA: hypothetical protein DCE18_12635, partial [Syntrophobacteraceae bacterium]|nr:hypothetical protein [Syntrophobacteraceae bacterium]
ALIFIDLSSGHASQCKPGLRNLSAQCLKYAVLHEDAGCQKGGKNPSKESDAEPDEDLSEKIAQAY